MSRTRIVKGNITEITGGNHKIYSKDIIENSGSKVIQVGKTDGVIYGQPEQPARRLIICDKNPTKYPNAYGNCIYYKWRFENFLERHKTCSHLPPVYYFGLMQTESTLPYLGNAVDKTKDWWSKVVNTEPLKPPYPKYEKGTPIVRESYGFKYCVIFSNYLMPKLSPGGKKWLKLARILLQKYMEQGLIYKNFESKYNKGFNKLAKIKTLNSVELDSSYFQKFAFATHPDAYLDAGLINISIKDKIEISLTPDFKEWASTGTWEQAWYVAKEQLKSWKNDASEYGKEKYDEARKYFEKRKTELRDKTDELSKKSKELLNRIESWF